MPTHSNYEQDIQRSITSEAAQAMGFSPGSWQARLSSRLMAVPTARFARLAAKFDRLVAEDGFPAAARAMLPLIVKSLEVSGVDNIPADGPLIIASNHPGAFDGLVLLAQLNRNDIQLIVSDVPFTRGLQATPKHLIYTPLKDGPGRLTALRSATRALRDGSALMLFPTGVVDPDPAFMPGASLALQDWSPSLEFFLERIPETRLMPVIISGVLEPRFMNNPIARRQETLRKRQKAAEYLEIAQVLLLGRKLGLTPRISFGPALNRQELRECSLNGALMPAIHAAAGVLLADHMLVYGILEQDNQP